MKLRTMMYCTVAGTLLFAAPLAAAPMDRYNTNPTPQERAQTDQLNNAAADRARGDADANDAARAQHADDVDRFNRDNDRVNADRARYERDRARYEADNGVHRWDVFFGSGHFRDVTQMRSRELMGLKVSTRGGSRVGTIRDVDSDRRGRVSRVAISVGGGSLAWVDTDDLRFDPATRVVYTTLSRDQVNSMARMRYPRF